MNELEAILKSSPDRIKENSEIKEEAKVPKPFTEFKELIQVAS